jgi:pimeloyl-ACP methyl ester carboxylesterase
MSASLSVFTSTGGEASVMRAYHAILDAWPVPYEELTVPTTFGDTHVIASGRDDAPPVVLLHALLATATSWYRTVGALAESHRVYAVDVMGEGNPSQPVRPMRTLDDFLGWFTELLDGLGIDTLDTIGNSYGGFTGAYYAMKLGGRVRRLVLVSPAATIHSMWPFMAHMFVPKAAYLMLPWLPGQRRAMRHSLDWMHNGLPRDPLWAPLFYRSLLHGRLINQVFPRVYSAAEFAQIRADVLLLIGAREAIYDPAEAIESARALLPRAEVDLIPDAHHIAALAQPAFVNRRILDFLGATSRPPQDVASELARAV